MRKSNLKSAKMLHKKPCAEFDAIVIGTGFGGAVAACRLAQARQNVLVLERGRRYGPDYTAFPKHFNLLGKREWLWNTESRGLFDIKPGWSMTIVQAAGCGGGSLIYANVHVQAPPQVFESGWPAWYNATNLQPYYNLVAYMLNIAPITTNLPSKSKVMEATAKMLGRDGQFFRPNLAVILGALNPAQAGRPQFAAVPHAPNPCDNRGDCVIGCGRQAKNTLDFNYLKIAEDRGATIKTDCLVTKIEPPDPTDPKKLYRVTYLDQSNEGEDRTPDDKGAPAEENNEATKDAEKTAPLAKEATALARNVFLCAGAFNSTELLLRCRDQFGTLPLISPSLGTKYSGNGDSLGFAFDTKAVVEPTVGPTITSAVIYNNRVGQEPIWFMLEDGGYPVKLSRLVQMIKPRGSLEILKESMDSVGAIGQMMALGIMNGSQQLPLSQLLNRLLPGAQRKDISRVIDQIIGSAGITRIDQVLSFLSILTPEQERTVRQLIVDLLGSTRDALVKPTPSDRTAVFLMMGRDRSNGTILLNPGAPNARIDWNVPSNKPLYDAEEELVLDFAESQGARNVSGGSAADVFDGNAAFNPLWKRLSIPLSVHNLGGCPMSDDESDGVVNQFGEVWGYPGLYVIDGSILPASTGVNPSHTIAAVAERNIQMAIGRAAPEYAAAQIDPVPEPMLRPLANGGAPPGSTRPTDAPSITINFRERMTGSLYRRNAGDLPLQVELDAEITTSLLDEFLINPNRECYLGGKFRAQEYTDFNGAEIENGRFKLLFADRNGGFYARKMRYEFEFTSVAGTRYRFEGTKDIEDRRRDEPSIKASDRARRLGERLGDLADRTFLFRPELQRLGQTIASAAEVAFTLRSSLADIWTSVTRMEFSIIDPTPGGAGADQGSMEISTFDVFQVLVGMDVPASRGVHEKYSQLLRFGRFFSRSIFDVFIRNHMIGARPRPRVP
jgi:cholesterol oxidase